MAKGPGRRQAARKTAVGEMFALRRGALREAGQELPRPRAFRVPNKRAQADRLACRGGGRGD